MHRQAHTDGRRLGFLHEEHLARAGPQRRIAHRPLLHLGDAGGNGHDDQRFVDLAGLRFFDEVAQHGFRHFKIGDHAVLHRADGGDVARRAPDHPFGLFPHRQHLHGAALDRHDGGFAQDDAPPFHIDERGGGAEVDGEIVGEQAEKRVEASLKEHSSSLEETL